MKYLKCIIWDLDETLLDTSKLKIFRDMKNWETVRNSFHLVEEYDSLLQIYNRLHKNLNSVIVTNSPSWYCKALIQKFNIKTDHFFGYSRNLRPKPSPSSFLKAMNVLQLAASECISIGDNEKDLIASRRSSISFVGVTWGETNRETFYKLGADYIVSKPTDLIKLFNM